MNENKKTACFGRIFPDVSSLAHNRPERGKCFTIEVTSLGMGIQDRRVTVDESEWDNCQRCPTYRSCYDLSLAVFKLNQFVETL